MEELQGHHWIINALPVVEKHLGWTVSLRRGQPDTLILKEIVERWYPHPDAPEEAYIITTELKIRNQVPAYDIDAAPFWVMYHAQANIREPVSRLDTRKKVV